MKRIAMGINGAVLVSCKPSQYDEYDRSRAARVLMKKAAEKRAEGRELKRQRMAGATEHCIYMRDWCEAFNWACHYEEKAEGLMGTICN